MGQMTEVQQVRWLDSAVQNVQVDKHDFPTPVTITSVGFVVREDDDGSGSATTRSTRASLNGRTW